MESLKIVHLKIVEVEPSRRQILNEHVAGKHPDSINRRPLG